MMNLAARCLVEGEAEGIVAHWSIPLSFWGGLDAASGRVIDRSHPAFGAEIAGRVLAMPSGRGSSSASSVLAEAIRRGTAPAAIILTTADPIITVGAIVARKLYGRTCPVVVCAAGDFARLSEGLRVRVVAREGSCGIVASDV
jgi:predicted aconitase with swiveling domain